MARQHDIARVTSVKHLAQGGSRAGSRRRSPEAGAGARLNFGDESTSEVDGGGRSTSNTAAEPHP